MQFDRVPRNRLDDIRMNPQLIVDEIDGEKAVLNICEEKNKGRWASKKASQLETTTATELATLSLRHLQLVRQPDSAR
jgi:hypothetical protein